MSIPFNKPYLTGKETDYIKEAVASLKLSGNGIFTQKCQCFFENEYSIKKALLTNSCTAALEMAAILLNIKEGDEIIMPSYTFVSTANAFMLRGAVIRFCDSRSDHPGMDEEQIEALINKKTKAIVPVHYAGVACNMERIMEIASIHDLFVVEDAAQAIDSYYTFTSGKRRALGSIGHMAAFSFHETKNIISGEGGLLAINDEAFISRSEIIWEKGTNRSAFFRGEIDKYGWVDIGSSFLPSEVTAAFLWAQIENIYGIQSRRKTIWNLYHKLLDDSCFKKPIIPAYASNNAHMYYLVFHEGERRTRAIEHLKDKRISAVFHYISLHSSNFFKTKHDGRTLHFSDHYTTNLLRLPFFYELDEKQITKTCNILNEMSHQVRYFN